MGSGKSCIASWPRVCVRHVLGMWLILSAQDKLQSKAAWQGTQRPEGEAHWHMVLQQMGEKKYHRPRDETSTKYYRYFHFAPCSSSNLVISSSRP
jgi:hypothetical protein